MATPQQQRCSFTTQHLAVTSSRHMNTIRQCWLQQELLSAAAHHQHCAKEETLLHCMP